MFETEVFRKQMFCSEESTCDIARTFRRPSRPFGAPTVIWRLHSDSEPGELRPACAPAHGASKRKWEFLGFYIVGSLRNRPRSQDYYNPFCTK